MTQAPLSTQYWLRIQASFIITLVAGLFIFMLARLIMFGAYGEGFSAYSVGFMINDLVFGLRLDLKMLALGLVAPYFAVTALTLITPKLLRWVAPLVWLCNALLLVGCLLVAMLNHNYYGVFNKPIDVFIFDFFEPENTGQIIKTIWIDFPVVWIGLGGLIVIGLVLRGLALLPMHLAERLPQFRSSLAIRVYTLVAFLLLAVACRGAVVARPLTIARASLSPIIFLNQMVPNGALAAYDAYKVRKYSGKPKQVDEEVLRQSYQRYFGSQLQGPVTLNDYFVETSLKEDAAPTNVVVSMMESFGANLINYHGEDNDVLGALAEHLEQDYVFNRFTSSANGTVKSVERLVSEHALPFTAASSKYNRMNYLASAAKIFSEKGYRTVFVTSGRKAWNNFDTFMQHLGFQEVYDEYTILNSVSGAKAGRTWGVFDGYSYDFIRQLLEEESDRPVFVVLLTITNHSPFEPPEDYESLPLDVAQVQKISSLNDTVKMRQIMTTYQYSNHVFGRFVGQIKSNPRLAQSTIIAGAGDHELRYLFNLPASKASWKFRVPFYLYLPDHIQGSGVKDLSRVGSHKDIFPTIYNRIFANTSYYRLGVDLLSPEFDSDGAFAINDEFIMNDVGGIERQGSSKVFYEWVDDGFDNMQPAKKNLNKLKELNKRAADYETLWEGFTQLQIQALEQ